MWDYPRRAQGHNTYPGLKILFRWDDILFGGNDQEEWKVRVFYKVGWRDFDLKTRSLKKAKALALLF